MKDEHLKNLEAMRLRQKADWLRLAADIVAASDTKEEAHERLSKIVKQAEEDAGAVSQD